MRLVKPIGAALVSTVQAPQYGRQDIGYSPGGAMDQFSHQVGNIALGNAPFTPAEEIIAVGALECLSDCLFVLTGAKRPNARLLAARTEYRHATDIGHATIALAQKGDRITLGPPEYGFRTYLCLAPCDAQRLAEPQRRLVGRTLRPYREIYHAGDPQRRIRLLRGPEWDALERPESFLDQPWMTTLEMSAMGIRLRSLDGAPPPARRTDIISAPVHDGTIQLTPGGPIVLMRNRQTLGGYPRIYSVIGPDVDLLAQYAPHQALHFREVTIEHALECAAQKQRDLDAFREEWTLDTESG